MNVRMGFGPGNIDCGDVLEELSVFLDDETDDATKSRIAQHLNACSPCLRQLGLEKDVRALISRCCGGDRAPDSLRTRISVRITEITLVE
ncbi:mycothiol system anti-sigma-R factor [uncultured Jatrophihabitans sp.]|uniref:mycothiol system anti-sigma-R factor n=1 Tax=uncultured Jatrophihabitans sp. TaxID=1610747 RepID=UPI0035C95D52